MLIVSERWPPTLLFNKHYKVWLTMQGSVSPHEKHYKPIGESSVFLRTRSAQVLAWQSDSNKRDAYSGSLTPSGGGERFCVFFLAAIHILLEERLMSISRKCRETLAMLSKSSGHNKAAICQVLNFELSRWPQMLLKMYELPAERYRHAYLWAEKAFRHFSFCGLR